MTGTIVAGVRINGQESQLVDYLQRLEKHRFDRRAVHVRLSALQQENRREKSMRMALEAFEPLAKSLNGQAFTLANKDLMVIYKDQGIDELESSLVRVRFIFGDDPMLQGDGGSNQGNFVHYYSLEKEYEQVVSLVDHLHQEEIARVRSESERLGRLSRIEERKSGQPFTSELLGLMEQALAQADLANVLRRQAICALVGKAPPRPVLNEVFVSINDLRQTLLPSVELNSSPWLFQQLTETLDRRVLSLLSKHDDKTLSGDISINLNVSTILSPEFQVFDDNVKSAARGTIVLELQKVDIFADLGAYLFARDYAHDRGYRILVDGLSVNMLPYVDRERLGADLIKLIWDPSMADEGVDHQKVLKNVGLSRVILARCDTPSAIEWGNKAGLTLFQGRYVEQALADSKRRRTSAAKTS